MVVEAQTVEVSFTASGRPGASQPKIEQEQIEAAVIRRREPIQPVNRTSATEFASSEPASPVRRPVQIQFAPPTGFGTWRITGRLNWPFPNHGVPPLCEWINNEGSRIWLSAQLKELAVEFVDGAEDGWRELAMRSRALLGGVVQHFNAPLVSITLCYLHLAADVVA